MTDGGPNSQLQQNGLLHGGVSKFDRLTTYGFGSIQGGAP